ncbi:MAG TPA: hypothetical protein VMF91_18450 [Bryobacteraceae bacterium]|nr:hypothetical protein [Bryobacteraceae bacterium]
MLVQKFQGAKVTEQGVTFGIVSVKPHVLQDKNEAERLIANFQVRVFPGTPVVLMAQDAGGVPTYFGRRDIAQFLSRVPVQAIPWREFTVAVG